MLFSTPKHRGATTTEKLRGTKVWVPTLGCLAACAPCPDQRPGWGWMREGSPLPAVGVRDFWTQMLNPAFWWLLRSLVGSRGRVYPNKQQECQGLNQFQNFNFSAVVAPLFVRTKNQSNGNYEIRKFIGVRAILFRGGGGNHLPQNWLLLL